jgi:hypothetical protein
MATLLKVLNNLADIKSAGGVALRVRTQALADVTAQRGEVDRDRNVRSRKGHGVLPRIFHRRSQSDVAEGRIGDDRR